MFWEVTLLALIVLMLWYEVQRHLPGFYTGSGSLRQVPTIPLVPLPPAALVCTVHGKSNERRRTRAIAHGFHYPDTCSFTDLDVGTQAGNNFAPICYRARPGVDAAGERRATDWGPRYCKIVTMTYNCRSTMYLYVSLSNSENSTQRGFVAWQ